MPNRFSNLNNVGLSLTASQSCTFTWGY